MIQRAKDMWGELRRGTAGERFQHLHQVHSAHRSTWARVLTLVAAIVSFVIGLILAFIPGPAVVFFALTAALAAVQSLAVARWLDTSELKMHALLRRWREH
jgi:hypothetical protein